MPGGPLSSVVPRPMWRSPSTVTSNGLVRPVVAVGGLHIEVVVDRHDRCAGTIEPTEHERVHRRLDDLRLVGANAGQASTSHFSGGARDIGAVRQVD